MIPEFNDQGNIPEGVHKATLGEVEIKLASISARRKWLFERLKSLTSLQDLRRRR
jgi:hypothetical protein